MKPVQSFQQEDAEAARLLLSDLPEELAIFDALGESADELTRRLCARILAHPVNTGLLLVFEASLNHNMADSCEEGVKQKILGAAFKPVVLSRTVS